MRIIALTVLLLAMPLSASTPANSVQPFNLNYSVYRNQAMLGVAELQNKQASPGYWQFISKTTATKGVATIAGTSINEQSNLIVRNGLLELFSNQLVTKVAWKTMQKTTKLDDAGKTYVYKDSKGTKQAAYQPGLLDQHSLTLALIADLNAKKKGPSFVYMVVNREKVEPYTFKIVATQTISTALGKLNTIRVDRIRESSNGKTTRIWFAVDKNYMPVLIQQNDENGDDIEMRILTFN